MTESDSDSPAEAALGHHPIHLGEIKSGGERIILHATLWGTNPWNAPHEERDTFKLTPSLPGQTDISLCTWRLSIKHSKRRNITCKQRLSYNRNILKFIKVPKLGRFAKWGKLNWWKMLSLPGWQFPVSKREEMAGQRLRSNEEEKSVCFLMTSHFFYLEGLI